MNKALYFPHTTPRDKRLLKGALLLWEALEFIVPWEHFDHHTRDREVLDALNVIGHPITPSEAAKERTHTRIKRLIAGGLPAKYLMRPGVDAAPIYADKLARKTWRMLEEAALTGGIFEVRRGARWSYDYNLAPPLSLAIMTILAEECAGKTARKLTDGEYALNSQAAFLTKDLGGDLWTVEPEHDSCVLEIPIPILSLDQLSLSELTRLRQEESDFVRELRVNYRMEMDKYLSQLTAPGSREDDLRRIIDDFNTGMARQIRELYRMINRRAIISEFNMLEILGAGLSAGAVTYLGSGNSLAAGLAGAVGGVGVTGLFKMAGSVPLNDEKREEVLRKNPAAWLYHVREVTAV